jgi:hypothetical protein
MGVEMRLIGWIWMVVSLKRRVGQDFPSAVASIHHSGSSVARTSPKTMPTDCS